MARREDNTYLVHVEFLRPAGQMHELRDAFLDRLADNLGGEVVFPGMSWQGAGFYVDMGEPGGYHRGTQAHEAQARVAEALETVLDDFNGMSADSAQPLTIGSITGEWVPSQSSDVTTVHAHEKPFGVDEVNRLEDALREDSRVASAVVVHDDPYALQVYVRLVAGADVDTPALHAMVGGAANEAWMRDDVMVGRGMPYDVTLAPTPAGGGSVAATVSPVHSSTAAARAFVTGAGGVPGRPAPEAAGGGVGRTSTA